MKAKRVGLNELPNIWRDRANEKYNGVHRYSERFIVAMRTCADELEAAIHETPIDLIGSAGIILAVCDERDDARYCARVLASAWKNDARPPVDVVQRALAFPVEPIDPRRAALQG